MKTFNQFLEENPLNEGPLDFLKSKPASLYRDALFKGLRQGFGYTLGMPRRFGLKSTRLLQDDELLKKLRAIYFKRDLGPEELAQEAKAIKDFFEKGPKPDIATLPGGEVPGKIRAAEKLLDILSQKAGVQFTLNKDKALAHIKDQQKGFRSPESAKAYWGQIGVGSPFDV